MDKQKAEIPQITIDDARGSMMLLNYNEEGSEDYELFTRLYEELLPCTPLELAECEWMPVASRVFFFLNGDCNMFLSPEDRELIDLSAETRQLQQKLTAAWAVEKTYVDFIISDTRCITQLSMIKTLLKRQEKEANTYCEEESS